MAKTHAPLLSIDASGKLGGAVIFSRWKKVGYARKYAKPGGAPSPAQLAQRAGMRTALDWAQEQFFTEVGRAAWRASQRVHAPMTSPWAWCLKVFLDALKTQP